MTGRRPVLGNADVRISYAVAGSPPAATATPPATSACTSRRGTATVETVFGALEVGPGDYVDPAAGAPPPLGPAGTEPLRGYAIEANSPHHARPSATSREYGSS